ncbi:probable LRR receptor-like serine/threonine-protein kinase At3g47570 [Neltuma alba]|uniref:probable LRR receptor-like serine/threonine-protein kinase At3g47570 n=1 Tax=Neltuma alba TaxID=207710 RepID=UPI0010A581A8|nr:probable LRR receptor-like serine/threonine-protein kinase At3g47570 [Prosopis alba]
MPSLTYVAFGMNHLKGNMPEEMCHHLPLLEAFDVYGHQLEGGFLPKGIGSLDKLDRLDLSSNHFKGPIPFNIFNISTLTLLNLGSNFLSGLLPSYLGIGLPNLKNLVLEGNELTGQIPNSISNASQLIRLRLPLNTFTKAIPNVIGNLTNLLDLALDGNELTGLIPYTFGKLHSLQGLSLSNNKLQGSIVNDLCQLKRLSIIFLKQNRDDANYTTKRDLTNLDGPTRISHCEILQGTNGFDESNLLGSGSFGSVYKAILPNEKVVAIKVFNTDMEKALRSFDIECDAMCNLRHRNLIKIISCCSNNDFKCLIMEFMSNGSLDRWLYSHNYCLDILQRLNIMVDVAIALEYLHHGTSTPIVYCDIKPSNVLFNEDMVAHLSDFGIAKLLGERQLETYTTTLATVGYMAPGNSHYKKTDNKMFCEGN